MKTEEFIHGQRALLEAALGRFARPGDHYALLDFPDHANVGDSAIWLGARAILETLTGHGPVHVAGSWRGGLAGLGEKLGAATIYVTGGGNFGDLWPGAQVFREKLMARFAGNRIVQLPQSIHFQSAEALDRCTKAIGRHGNFHLLTRDAASESFARAHFDCPVALAPDCAFGLGPLEPSADPRCDLLCLLRTDKEGLAVDRSAIARLRPRFDDWLSEATWPVERLKLSILADRLLSRCSARTHLFDRIAEIRLKRGIGLLSSGRQVVTDRLHGHLICVLLDIPHVALDNSYGKISSYCETWSDGGDTSRFAGTSEAALAALAELPKRPWSGPLPGRPAGQGI